MSIIYLVRHGESECTGSDPIDPSDRIVHGQYDAQLTNKGRKQSAELGQRLGHKVRSIICSDLSRTWEGLDIAWKEIPRNQRSRIAVSVTRQIREQSVGILEGVPEPTVRADFPHLADGTHWRSDPTKRVPDGETYYDVCRRALPELYDALKTARGDILLLSHRNVIRPVVGSLCGLSREQILQLKISHAEPLIITNNSDNRFYLNHFPHNGNGGSRI